MAGSIPGVGGYFYRPGDTRPLSIVNTDNRLLASAVRIVFEPILAAWISPWQRGFLKGRSMTANILDIELHSRLMGYANKQASMIFFAFKAAFPNIFHAFMWKVLDWIGLPAEYLRFIRALYQGNVQRVRMHTYFSEGFTARCGVRQGCPISPLIFATVVDILLRRLVRRYEGIVLRAFADDIGIVAPRLHM